MLAVIDALSQDGLGNLFRLLAELPAKIPITCIDVFIHVANECVATAHLPAGVEDLFIRSAIAILLDNETAGATVASISKTMLRVAIAEPAYAQAMATALEPHMAVAPTRKLARDLLLNPCSIHLPDYALRQLGMRQSLHDRVRIVCELITLDVPAEAVLPLTQTLPSHSDGRLVDINGVDGLQNRLCDHVCDTSKAKIQAATNLLCEMVNQHGAHHPGAQLLIWLCTVAVEFKPSIDRISTAMGIRILLSSSFGYSHMVTMTNFGIGYLACVYPQNRWINGDDDMHCWMLFYE